MKNFIKVNGLLYYPYNIRAISGWSSEVGDPARSTRRWYRQGNPRDAGGADFSKSLNHLKIFAIGVGLV